MKDRFSDGAEGYATFRPSYPKELYDYIFGYVRNFDAAWDAGTGNGQVAADLAGSFRKVFGTDISAEQLSHAARAENIVYSVAGERLDQPDQSVDLITVAQAIHWFDREAFYNEVRRAGKPGACLAVWGYGLLKAGEVLDPILLDFYTRTVGPYWDAERKLVDERYTTIAFPFTEIKTPDFKISVQWNPDDMIGYLRTWSSVRNYRKASGDDPVTALAGKIGRIWPGGKKEINFPVFVRLGLI